MCGTFNMKKFIIQSDDQCSNCYFHLEKGESCFLDSDNNIFCPECAEGEEYDE